jgi:transcriptional regulator with XRE-family HTH domain
MISDRIRKIRTDAGLSQLRFAQTLSISRSAICKLESGENKPSEQTLAIIQKHFLVNADWLRTGIGEPYTSEDSRSCILRLLARTDDEFISLLIRLLKTYDQLDMTEKAVLRKFVKNMATKSQDRS